MANNNWAPQAVAVKQKITVTVGGTLAGETFKLGLGGQWFAEHTDTTTVIADTVAALVAAWNASGHPWAQAVTAVDASPNITLEADVAGVPFGDFLSDNGQTWETGVRGYYEIDLNTPGGSATLTQDETTANRGPNCANLADNWDGTSYLADDEDVTIGDNGNDLLWGLDYSSDATNKVILNSLDIRKSFTGKIGLDYATFNGVISAPEYRGTYFQIMVDKDNGLVEIGKHEGPGSALGSRRIKLNLKGKGARIVMHGSNSQPFETGKPTVRILCDNTSGDSLALVRGAPGGFGIAMDQPGETSELSQLAINCLSLKDQVYTSDGVQLSHATNAFQMSGGYCLLRHVPTNGESSNKLARGSMDGGELWTEGDFVVNQFYQKGGSLYPNNYSSCAQYIYAFETLSMQAGVTDTRRSQKSRKWDDAIYYLNKHTLYMNSGVVTVATWDITDGAAGLGV